MSTQPQLPDYSKGFPIGAAGTTGWSVFDENVAYPVGVLIESAIDHNSALLRDYAARRSVSYAPHGKTTMAPALFKRQFRDGAWALTAANVWQARAQAGSGAPRVIIANQVVTPGEIRWIAEANATDLEVIAYADSVAGVDRFDSALATATGAARSPIPVLIELGIEQGRTGFRTIEEGLDVARAIVDSPHLQLRGVSGFDGILGDTPDRSARELVVEFLDRMVELAHAVDREHLFDATDEVVVTAGGSAYFDYVIDRLQLAELSRPTRIVIRSGCYISHDDGTLHQQSPMGETNRTGDDHEALRAAIEIWGPVLSRPEPDLALIGIGKRDASYDGLLPIAKKVRRASTDRVEDVAPTRVASMHDQHAFLPVDPTSDLAVGDLVGFGISHPCTTFDKWRSFVLVDDDYVVTEVAATLF